MPPISPEEIAARTTENRINLADNVKGVSKIQEYGGYLDVVMHGDAEGTQASIAGKPIDFSMEETARMVEGSPTWNDRPLRLMSCHTGSGDYAQQLADRLQVPVYAPTDYLCVYSDGTSEILHGGTWKRFEPKVR